MVRKKVEFRVSRLHTYIHCLAVFSRGQVSVLSAWDFRDKNTNIKKYDFLWDVMDSAYYATSRAHGVQEPAKCVSVIVSMRVNFKWNLSCGVVVEDEIWSLSVSKCTSFRPVKNTLDLLWWYSCRLQCSVRFLWYRYKFGAYERHSLVSFENNCGYFIWWTEAD